MILSVRSMNGVQYLSRTDEIGVSNKSNLLKDEPPINQRRFILSNQIPSIDKMFLSVGGFLFARKSAICGLFCICVVRIVAIVGFFEQPFSQDT